MPGAGESAAPHVPERHGSRSERFWTDLSAPRCRGPGERHVVDGGASAKGHRHSGDGLVLVVVVVVVISSLFLLSMVALGGGIWFRRVGGRVRGRRGRWEGETVLVVLDACSDEGLNDFGFCKELRVVCGECCSIIKANEVVFAKPEELAGRSGGDEVLVG